MTFIYNNFSLHSKLLGEGFEPYVSDDEFILEIEYDDTRFVKFLECVKFAYDPNPGYDFVIHGLAEYKGNDVESLNEKFNEVSGEYYEE